MAVDPAVDLSYNGGLTWIDAYVENDPWGDGVFAGRPFEEPALRIAGKGRVRQIVDAAQAEHAGQGGTIESGLRAGAFALPGAAKLT